MPILIQIPAKIQRAIAQALFFGAMALPFPAAHADPGTVAVGFSPDGNAEQLVLSNIGNARASIRLAAYSLSSPKVVSALIAAKRRAVDVQVVADYRNNVEEDRSGKQRAALGLLAGAGIPTRTVATYSIHHDKFCVVDGRDVQTGSFNYSTAAARYNSENVVVMYDRPDVAKKYLAHWQSRFDQGQAFNPRY